MLNLIACKEEEHLNNYRFKNWDAYLNSDLIGRITAESVCTGYDRGARTYSENQDEYGFAIYDGESFGRVCETYNTLIEAKRALLKWIERKGAPAVHNKNKVNVRFLTVDENDDFYPTPSKLAGIMFSGINKVSDIKNILEPSAGKGDLIDNYIKFAHRSYNRIEIDCIEADENLRFILEGKDYKVVYDDFLKYNGIKKYDLILMNPPFSEGAKHLIKAIELQKSGGQICCLLNAETLRNPYTNERKLLCNLLTKYNARVKYVENAFSSADAERKTSVSVAIIWLDIPVNIGTSKIYEDLKKAETVNDNVAEPTDLCFGGLVEGLISRFDFECKLCTELIREFEAAKPYLMESAVDKSYNKPILELEIDGSSYNGLNDALKKLRYKYWEKLLTNKELMSRFTSNLQEKYRNMIRDMADYDFNEFNVWKVVRRMNAEIIGGIEEEIYTIFDKLSAEHSWYPECKNNIHYYNGWKTNQAHKVGMKVIIPTNGVFSTYSWDKGSFNVNAAYHTLADIEKVFNYLDGNATADVDLIKMLEYANGTGKTKNINCKYFSVTFFKKGTVHIKMYPETEKIIEALNIYVGRGKNWLPPHYGKAAYDDLPDEEKTVINEFQGREAYEKVLNNPETYLYEIKADNILLLENNKGEI